MEILDVLVGTADGSRCAKGLYCGGKLLHDPVWGLSYGGTGDNACLITVNNRIVKEMSVGTGDSLTWAVFGGKHREILVICKGLSLLRTSIESHFEDVGRLAIKSTICNLQWIGDAFYMAYDDEEKAAYYTSTDGIAWTRHEVAGCTGIIKNFFDAGEKLYLVTEQDDAKTYYVEIDRNSPDAAVNVLEGSRIPDAYYTHMAFGETIIAYDGLGEGGSTIYYTADGPLAWEYINAPFNITKAFIAFGVLYIANDAGSIDNGRALAYLDSSGNFTSVTKTTEVSGILGSLTSNAKGVAYDGEKIYCLTDRGYLLSSDNGTEWTAAEKISELPGSKLICRRF